MDELDHRRADQFLIAVAEEVMGRGADETEAQRRVEQCDAAVALLDDGSEAPLALLQLFLRLASLGDVAHERGEGPVVAAAGWIDRDLDRKLFAVGAAGHGFDAPFDGSRPAGGAIAVERRGKDPLQAGREQRRRDRAPEDLAGGEAERGRGLRIPFDDVSGGVDRDDGIERGGDELAQP
jgi:hypothetical protein